MEEKKKELATKRKEAEKFTGKVNHMFEQRFYLLEIQIFIFFVNIA